MAQVETTQWVFEGLRVLVGFGVCKLFFWDLLLKEHWDNFKSDTKQIAESVRKNNTHH